MTSIVSLPPADPSSEPIETPWRPTNELRWVKWKDKYVGKATRLQQKWVREGYGCLPDETDWRDVPVVEEEKTA